MAEESVPQGDLFGNGEAPRREGRLTPQERQQVKDMRAEGKGTAEVARHFRITQQAVRMIEKRPVETRQRRNIPLGVEPVGVAEKRCHRCDVTKGAAEFYRVRAAPDGLDYWCKECRRETNRESHAKRLASYTPPEGGATRECCACHEVKSVAEFCKNRYGALGTTRYCRACMSVERLLGKYGLSVEEYREMEWRQGMACAICGTTTPTAKSAYRTLLVDHDHETNQVRDLLCDSCNTGLGGFRDDEGLLEKAVAYLRKHRAARGQ